MRGPKARFFLVALLCVCALHDSESVVRKKKKQRAPDMKGKLDKEHLVAHASHAVVELEIKVQHVPENCHVKTKTGDTVAMHYTVGVSDLCLVNCETFITRVQDEWVERRC